MPVEQPRVKALGGPPHVIRDHSDGRRKRFGPHPVQVLAGGWSLERGAEDLAVAVFGKTIEEAMGSLRAALESHMESVEEASQVEEIISYLQAEVRDFMSLDELPAGSPLVNLSLAMKNQKIVAVA